MRGYPLIECFWASCVPHTCLNIRNLHWECKRWQDSCVVWKIFASVTATFPCIISQPAHIHWLLHWAGWGIPSCWSPSVDLFTSVSLRKMYSAELLAAFSPFRCLLWSCSYYCPSPCRPVSNQLTVCPGIIHSGWLPLEMQSSLNREVGLSLPLCCPLCFWPFPRPVCHLWMLPSISLHWPCMLF